MIKNNFYETKVINVMDNKNSVLTTGKRSIKIKVHSSLHGVKKGTIIDIMVDEKDTPLDKHWRRRLRDAPIDGCVEIIENKSSRKDK